MLRGRSARLSRRALWSASRGPKCPRGTWATRSAGRARGGAALGGALQRARSVWRRPKLQSRASAMSESPV
eukprot:2883936-Alexandrium_andersonii.AAC.1